MGFGPATRSDLEDERVPLHKHIQDPPSLMRIVWITSIPAGIYCGFALQYALMTPFAKELGVSDRWASYIWLCGPVTGATIQPLVGLWSDRCAHRLGRRRPFLLIGAFCSLFGALFIATCRDIGGAIDPDSPNPGAITIFVIGFWILDASNNILVVVSRALVSDLVPAIQSTRAFALYQAWSAAGLCLGYLLGATRWDTITFGLATKLSTQFCGDAGGCKDIRIAFLFLSITVVLFVIIGCLAGRETPLPDLLDSASNSTGSEEPIHSTEVHGLRRPGKGSAVENSSGVEDESGGTTSTAQPAREDRSFLASMAREIRQLSPALRLVHLITFFSWIGWFTFQLYQTDFVAVDVYGGSPDENSPLNANYVHGIREASYGLIGFAALSWLMSFILPSVQHVVGPVNIWAASCTLHAIQLGSAALVHSSVGVILWLVAAAPMFTVTLTVPYTIVSRIGKKESQGALMGLLNLALCLAQFIVALAAGPLIHAFGSDVSVFFIGAAGNLVAVYLCVSLRQELGQSG